MNGPFADSGDPYYPLTIGGVPFRDEETPDDLKIGAGKQKTTVLELIGGGRVVQTFGAQPDPVTWSGRIWGPNVQARVKALRQMMVNGTEQLLSWKDEQYYCIVKEFAPKFHAIDCEYDITLEITRDANGAFQISQPTNIDAQSAAFLQNAVNENQALLSMDPAGPQVFQPALSTLQASIAAAGPLASANASSLQQILQDVTTATAAIQPYLAGLSTIAPEYISASRLLNLITLIGRNVEQGQAPVTQRIQGGSLFEVAATIYGDATQAFALAQANGVAMPRLPDSVLQEIALPPL